MIERRRMAVVVSAVVLLVAAGGVILTRKGRIEEGVAPSFSPDGGSVLPPTPELRGSAIGDPRLAAPSGKVRVRLLVGTRPESQLRLRIFAGPAPSSMDHLATVVSGAASTLEVPRDYTYWFAGVEPTGGASEIENYDDALLQLDQLRPDAEIRLVVPRASNKLRVLAQNLRGEPVGLVQLELSRAPRPEETRRFTDADGVAEWTEIRGDYLSPDGVRVYQTPGGLAVLEEPRVQVSRGEGTAGLTATARIVLDRCSGSIVLPIADVRAAAAILERASDQTWTKEERRGYWEITTTRGGGRPEPEFVDDGPPQPGQLRRSGLCPGKYRVTLVGGTVGALESLVEVRANDETEVRNLQPIEATRVQGRIRGPAAGVIRLAELRVLEGRSPLERLAGVTIPVGVSRDGTFQIQIPLGVGAVALYGPSNPSFILVPEANSIRDTMEFDSVVPSTLSGRLTDADGKGRKNILIGAQAEPIDSRGRFVEVGSHMVVGEVRTDEEGRWTLGPGAPGTWHIHISLPSMDVTKRVLVRQGSHEDIGDVVVGAD